MPTPKEIFRPTIDSDAIFALVDILEEIKRTTGLPAALDKFYANLDTQAYKIGRGHAKPAYVATGIKREPMVNLGALGATEEEVLTATHGREVIDDAKLTAFDYEMQYGIVLPYQRFIGKTMHEVHAEETAVQDKNIVTEVVVREVEVPVVPALDTATSFKERIIAEHHNSK